MISEDVVSGSHSWVNALLLSFLRVRLFYCGAYRRGAAEGLYLPLAALSAIPRCRAGNALHVALRDGTRHEGYVLRVASCWRT